MKIRAEKEKLEHEYKHLSCNCLTDIKIGMGFSNLYINRDFKHINFYIYN